MTSDKAQRFHELDSLRGIAALTVVFNHFQEMWLAAYTWPNLTSVQRLIVSICHPLFAGHEAVVIFFVLSGFVLSLPYHRGHEQTYRVFILRRFFRIYCPYFVALALTLICVSVWHHDLHRGAWAAHTWSRPLDAKLVAQHVFFLGVYDWHQYNFVIWSLIYEMRISLVFPFLIVIVDVLSEAAAVGLVACSTTLVLFCIRGCLDTTWRYSLLMTVHYIAFFIVGILLARSHSRIGEFYESMGYKLRVALFATSLFFYTESWHVIGKLSNFIGPNEVVIIYDWLVMLGAVGVVVTALHSRTLKRWLMLPPPLFLGKISYSLYLVHIPILFALTFLLGSRISPWLQLPIYLVGALTAGTIFFYIVEFRFTKFSHSFARRLES